MPRPSLVKSGPSLVTVVSRNGAVDPILLPASAAAAEAFRRSRGSRRMASAAAVAALNALSRRPGPGAFRVRRCTAAMDAGAGPPVPCRPPHQRDTPGVAVQPPRDSDPSRPPAARDVPRHGPGLGPDGPGPVSGSSLASYQYPGPGRGGVRLGGPQWDGGGPPAQPPSRDRSVRTGSRPCPPRTGVGRASARRVASSRVPRSLLGHVRRSSCRAPRLLSRVPCWSCLVPRRSCLVPRSLCHIPPSSLVHTPSETFLARYATSLAVHVT